MPNVAYDESLQSTSWVRFAFEKKPRVYPTNNQEVRVLFLEAGVGFVKGYMFPRLASEGFSGEVEVCFAIERAGNVHDFFGAVTVGKVP